jgi:hypothetical protein
MQHFPILLLVGIAVAIAAMAKTIYDHHKKIKARERYLRDLPRKYHTCSWDVDYARLWVTLRERIIDPVTGYTREIVLDRVEVNYNDLNFLADNAAYNYYGLAYMFDQGLLKMAQFKPVPRKKYVRNLPEWF